MKERLTKLIKEAQERYIYAEEQAQYLIDNGVDCVKHGEWILLDECANEGVYCSVCHKKVYRVGYANQKLKSNYCPNCGAKMDGATDNNVGDK